MQYFTLDSISVLRNYCIAIARTNFCVWQCLAPATRQLLKNCRKKMKTLTILAIFPLANFSSAPCSQVATFFRAIAMQQFLKIAFQSQMKNKARREEGRKEGRKGGRKGGRGAQGLRGSDDQIHSCHLETFYSMMPKLCDF